MKSVILSCYAVLSIAFGCASSEGEDDAMGVGGAKADSELRYEDVEPIFADKCVRCHSDPPENGAPLPLDTYERIRQERADVLRMVSRGLMPLLDPGLSPPVEDLTEEERSDLITWLEAGAPE